MNGWEPRQQQRQNGSSNGGRLIQMIVGGILVIVFISIIANSCSDRSSQWGSSAVAWSQSESSSGQDSSSSLAPNTVPWDYQIVEGTVGDLIGGDMTVLPGNELLPNDDNYATGDKIWTLQFMGAVMNTGDDNRASITLTAWKAIKSFKSQEAAESDMAKLKLSLKTDVDLVGVYKTSYEGQTRDFAVLTLPSGQQVKQPIDDARYDRLKSEKQAAVILEEVHDYSNYDLAYAKFRGWAD
ncbi:hypothetical protein COLU111180_07130 [Cohnella lubricantis]|uniref:Signal peptide protein n=1 Tax=Cohnella lubricantis TaxID=2163172 RepID=A0A841TI06_9BACL|nr:hypothetical protein [Cohnella lubricantis]MBB6678577.1 signal peptide protein [Cohnella lubricantis]MBP2119113.1 hypothetical protein [Cohnella lubricantis]